jgi:hypothetical protein
MAVSSTHGAHVTFLGQVTQAAPFGVTPSQRTFASLELVRLYSNPQKDSGLFGQLRHRALSRRRASGEPSSRVPQRVRQRLGQETIERIVTEYATGTSSTRLAKSYGVGKGTLLSLIRESGVPIRRRGQRVMRLSK